MRKMQFIFFVPPNEELKGTLHSQKFWCTPKNEGKRVHVPPDEKTCGHALLNVNIKNIHLSSKYIIISPLHRRGVYCFTSVCLSFRPSQDIFLSNYWWQKSDIWSQASYRNTVLWEVFFGPVGFLLPVCRLSWFLYTLNIYVGVS